MPSRTHRNSGRDGNHSEIGSQSVHAANDSLEDATTVFGDKVTFVDADEPDTLEKFRMLSPAPSHRVPLLGRRDTARGR
jgi:hypothetical protein